MNAHTTTLHQPVDYATDPSGLLNGWATIPQAKALFVQAAAELKKYLQ